MRITGKLLIVLLVAAIAVIFLNIGVDLNGGSFMTPPAVTSDSSVSASPTLRAPVQESVDTNLPDQNLSVMLSIIGFIGIMVLVVNFMRWKR